MPCLVSHFSCSSIDQSMSASPGGTNWRFGHSRRTTCQYSYCSIKRTYKHHARHQPPYHSSQRERAILYYQDRFVIAPRQDPLMRGSAYRLHVSHGPRIVAPPIRDRGRVIAHRGPYRYLSSNTLEVRSPEFLSTLVDTLVEEHPRWLRCEFLEVSM